MRTMRYIVIGDITQDVVVTISSQAAHESCRLTEGEELLLKLGAKVPAEDCRLSFGGNAANVSVALRRLAEDVRLVSHAGRDSTGDAILKALTKEKVDVQSVHREATATNHSIVLLYGGERTIVSFHGAGSYQLPRLRRDDWLIMSSMGEGERDVIKRVLALDLPLAYLPGTRQLQLPRTMQKRLLKKAQLLLVNEEEARILTDSRERDPVILAACLRSLGAPEVVVTNGKHGAVAVSETGAYRVGVWHQVPRVDPTGAGDAFAATYVWARTNGASTADSLRWASFNAGSVVSEYGAQSGLMSRTQLRRAVKQHQLAVREEDYEPKR